MKHIIEVSLGKRRTKLHLSQDFYMKIINLYSHGVLSLGAISRKLSASDVRISRYEVSRVVKHFLRT